MIFIVEFLSNFSAEDERDYAADSDEGKACKAEQQCDGQKMYCHERGDAQPSEDHCDCNRDTATRDELLNKIAGFLNPCVLQSDRSVGFDVCIHICLLDQFQIQWWMDRWGLDECCLRVHVIMRAARLCLDD